MTREEDRRSLEEALTSLPAGEERIRRAVDELCRIFRVTAEEVAFLFLDEDKTLLRFQWPERLRKIGFIPLSSNDSLAARTAREKKAFLNNRFASVHHASIFESVRLSPEKKEKSLPIQNIMSVPLSSGGRIRGVVQVSRKGDSRGDTKNFSSDDLKELADISKILGRSI